MPQDDCVKIMKYIQLNPNSKSKEIAKATKICKREINQFLHRERRLFPFLNQTTDHGWVIAYE
tara:strand:- start:78 stop:266 length:189 start_codon:yes stop_codon:yes gene_type:complete